MADATRSQQAPGALTGRVAVITGVARGIGREAAVTLARHLGVSPQALNNWLSRRQDPPAHVALELQDFMRRKKTPRKARQNQEEELFVT